MNTNEGLANRWWEGLSGQEKEAVRLLFGTLRRLPVGQTLEVRRGHKFLLLLTAPRQHVPKQGLWRVLGVKDPMDYEGRLYHPAGTATWKSGWFWIRRGDECWLYVRVHGLQPARWLCRQLNGPISRRRTMHRL